MKHYPPMTRPMRRNRFTADFWRTLDIATWRDLLWPVGITVGILVVFGPPYYPFWRGIVWVAGALGVGR